MQTLEQMVQTGEANDGLVSDKIAESGQYGGLEVPSIFSSLAALAPNFMFLRGYKHCKRRMQHTHPAALSNQR